LSVKSQRQSGKGDHIVDRENLANAFRNRAERIIAVVEDCDPRAWNTITIIEGWPVASVAQHIADGVRFHASILARMSHGRALPDVTMTQIDSGNEAYRDAHLSHDEVLDALRENTERAAGLIDSLTEEQLSRTAMVPIPREAMLTARQFIEQVMLPHISMHTDSIMESLSREPGSAR
jgi:hypothetical protein